MSLFSELRRRNVFRVAIAYLAASWLLIEVADTIFPYFDLGEAAVRILIILLAIGFPLFLAFSWVFELTPEGLKLERDIRCEESITAKAGKTLDRVIIVLLAVALGYFALDKFAIEPRRVAEIVEETAEQARSDMLVESYGDKSIAVLPFVNMSADPEQEYFSDGISEELLNLLAQTPELRVISRSSAFSFKGKDLAIPEVARQLNVTHILEGSVRKSGDRVRITAQLIEARSDTHLWSKTYDRTLDDIFAVQDEIAAAISGALKLKLAVAGGETGLPAAIRSVNREAYDAYLQGRELIHGRDMDDLQQAIRLLQRSISLDNSFAPAHAHLAIATLLYHGYGDEEARHIAERHLGRAQELDPGLAEAHAGWALYASLDDQEAAIQHARKALAVNPNYIDAMNWLSNALWALGRDEETDEIFERMLVTDPRSTVVRRAYATGLMQRGRFEEAHAIADQIIELSPRAGYSLHAQISYMCEGNVAETLYWALRAPGGVGAGNFRLIDSLSAVGLYDEARRLARNSHWIEVSEGRWDDAVRNARERLRRHPDSAGANSDTAHVLLLAGYFEEALALYERALELSPEARPFLWYGPFYMTHLAFLRRQAGDEEGAQAAAATVRQAVAERGAGDTRWLPDVYEAFIAAFDHDPDRAVAALAAAVRHGLRSRYVIEDPLFDDFHNDARFVAVRQELDKILAGEREKVLQLICFNNPVPNEWEPLPETCEGVEKRNP